MDVRHLDFYWVVPKIEAEVDAGQRDGFPRKGLHKDLHSPPLCPGGPLQLAKPPPLEPQLESQVA